MIYTFYSFKGGVGRSMALANVAQILAHRGLHVLMVDFDLEAPGLERFFDRPDSVTLVEEVKSRRGVIDLLLSYRRLRTLSSRLGSVSETDDDKGFPYPTEPVSNFLVPLAIDAESSGRIDLIPAGRRAGDDYEEYAKHVRAFDWQDFYLHWSGQAFFDWFRDECQTLADVVLVDSRTGLTEMSGVCTFQLADVVVMLVAPNRQNLEGCNLVAQSLESPDLVRLARAGRHLRVLPVPSRIDQTESPSVESFAHDFERNLARYAPSELSFENSLFIDLKLPYVPRYSFTESLAVLEPDQPVAADLIAAYGRLTAALVDLAAPQEVLYLTYHGARPEPPAQAVAGELFSPRPWLLDEVNRWFASERSSALLLTGEPGCGKTAFVRWLTRTPSLSDDGTADGRDLIVSAGEDQTVRMWDAATGLPLGSPLTGHAGPVTAVAIGQVAGRGVIVSGSWDGTVRVWDPVTRQPVGEPVSGHAGGVTAVAIGRVAGRGVIVSGSWDGTVRVWDPVTRQPVGEPVSGHAGGVTAVAIGRVADRDVIVSGSSDQTVRMWDAATGLPLGSPLTGHAGGVTAVAIGRVADRDVIVSGSSDQTVRMWDAATGLPLGSPLTGHADGVTAVAIGQVAGRGVIVSGSWDGTVRVWDAATGQLAGQPLSDHNRKVNVVAIGRVAERDVIVSGNSDNTVQIWDAITGQGVGAQLTGHTSGVTAVAVGRTGDGDVRGRILYLHECHLHDPTTLDPARLVEHLAAALVQSVPGYASSVLGSRIHSVSVRLRQAISATAPNLTTGELELVIPPEIDARVAYDEVVRRPLLNLRSSGQLGVVVIDGLDVDDPSKGPGTLTNFVAHVTSPGSPTPLRWLVTSRPTLAVRELPGARLDITERVESRADVYAYARERLLSRSLPTNEVAEQASALSEASEGNFLFARLALDQYEVSSTPLNDAIQTSFRDVGIELLTERLRDTSKEERDQDRLLLGLLAVSGTPMTRRQLRAITHWKSPQVDRILNRWSALLQKEDPGGTYRFFHSFLRTVVLSTPSLRIPVAMAHAMLAEYFARENQGRWGTAEDYALSEAVTHALLALDDQDHLDDPDHVVDILVGMLTDSTYLVSRVERLGLNSVVADFNHGLRLLAQGLRSPAVRDELKRLIQVGGADLASHPVLAGTGPDSEVDWAVRDLGRHLVVTLAKAFADAYETVRRQTGPSRARTAEMAAVVREFSAIASHLSSFDLSIHELLDGSDGMRVMALALLQIQPDPSAVGLLVEGISSSRSAFEQYQALLAADRVLPLLDASARRDLRQSLTQEASDSRRLGVTSDPSRGPQIADLLKRLESEGRPVNGDT
ncbi:KGGVGR-motif variant AAA ATPase [Geodermatophilus sp. URMC 63]